MASEFNSLQNDFRNEALTMLDQAENLILRIEQENHLENSKELINNLFRAVHTVKGISGFFDYLNITQITHSLENLLGLIRSDKLGISLDLVDTLLLTLDFIKKMVRDVDHLDSYDVEPFQKKIDIYLDLPSKKHLGDKNATVASMKMPPKNKWQSKALEHMSSNSPQTPKLSEKKIAGKQGPFKVSKKIVQNAIKEKAYLHLISFDLLSTGAQTVNELVSQWTDFFSQREIIEKGIMMTRVPQLTLSSPFVIPFYLLVQCPLSKQDWIKSEAAKPLKLYNISAKITQLYSPTNSLKQENNKPEAKENSNKKNVAHGLDNSAQTSQENAELPLANPDTHDSHLKVPIELIDELINLAGETVIARNELIKQMENDKNDKLRIVSKKISYFVTKLQEGIMRTRLQRIDKIKPRLSRIVRDVTRQTGKQVMLEFKGGEVELDKSLMDAINDPIMHLIRNAIDHGIETPKARLETKKSEEGKLIISASQRGGNVIISISDDGRGLDIEGIKAKALEKGMVSFGDLEKMTTEEIADFIFEPSFSTREKISHTSGRGVGMDVVRSNLKKIGGSVNILTKEGAGTTFTAILPQSLSIITCLVIEISNERLAIPQQNILEIIKIDATKISVIEGKKIYDLRGHLLPLVDLNETLYQSSRDSLAKYIVVVRTGRHWYGIIVDRIINPEEIVVKPLGEHFFDLEVFSGAAIMGDGEAILILDVIGLASWAKIQSNVFAKNDEKIRDVSGQDLESGYLVFQDHDQQYAISANGVPRVERISGKEITPFLGVDVIQYREEIVPIVKLSHFFSNNSSAENARYHYAIIFNIQGKKISFAASAVLAVLDKIEDLDKEKFKSLAIKGHAIIFGKPTIIIDAIHILTKLLQPIFQKIEKVLGGQIKMVDEGLDSFELYHKKTNT